MVEDAHAFWLRDPGRGEIRPVALPEPGRGDVVVPHAAVRRQPRDRDARVPGVPARTPPRAPFQEGDFPGPVKYGYLSVGAVEQGPPELRGRTVFCLYPHQTAYVVPAGAVTVVPDDVPPARAVLAGTVETAVNALWDARAADRRPGRGRRRRDGRLLRRAAARAVPGGRGHARRRRPVARRGRRRARRRLRAAGRRRRRVRPRRAHERDRRRAPALARAARAGGHGLELSWYGDAEVPLSLGGAFHSGRLRIRASQVGTVSPARSARRTTADRLALALDLLRDPAFDVLVTGESRFDELPGVMERLAAGSLPALCHTITYGGE